MKDVQEGSLNAHVGMEGAEHMQRKRHAAEMAQVAQDSISSAVAAPSPWETVHGLEDLAMKYAEGTFEHRLLRMAASLLGSKVHEAESLQRGVADMHRAYSGLEDRIRLAKIALNNPNPV